MYTDDTNTNSKEQSSFLLFNIDALKNSQNYSLPPITYPSFIDALNDKGFLKKPQNFDKNIDIIIQNRGRKSKKQPDKDINSKDITIKEIMEDQQS